MLKTLSLASVLALCASLTACGSDAPGDEAPGPDAGAGEADAGESETGEEPIIGDPTEGLPTVRAFGRVEVDGDGSDAGLAGATITLLGSDPPITATSDSNGDFAMLVPVGVRFFHLQADGYWGVVFTERITLHGPNDIDPSLFASDEQIAEYSAMFPSPQLDTNGVVAFDFTDNHAGGERATISLTADDSLTVTGDEEAPTVSETLLANGNPVLIYPNTEPGIGTITVTGAQGVTICAPVHPGITHYPVMAKSITDIEVECTTP